MRGKHLSYFIFAILLLFAVHVYAQSPLDRVIQINGVTMTADSLRAVEGVTISVKNQNRGVETNHMGVFTLVCFKGDTLQFNALGFRAKEFVIPKDSKGQYFSLIQLMVQDTFYLPETIIRPLPEKGQFDFAFKHWRIPDDQYEMARKNTDAVTLRALAYTLPHDGREAQSIYQSQQWHDAVYYGQRQPMNILNPLAWADFFQAWKRGDYRKQSQPSTDYDY